MNFCIFHKLKTENYAHTLDYQRYTFENAISNKQQGIVPMNELISVEHNHVYTFGKHAEHSNLLVNSAFLQTLGAETFEIERGGDITYHGPGQLVVYPIFDLEQLNIGIKQFVANIELAIIKTLFHYNIEAGIIPDRIGVWLDIGKPTERKIAAIGIKSSRYVTMHGLALNVNTDLSMFQHIVPCGIVNKGVTSMEKELNEKIDMFEVNSILVKQFKSIFELQDYEQQKH
jgi:lipoyl(octanoyl) transferase